MVVFDINETLFYNIGISAFSLVVALIVYISNKKTYPEAYDVLLFSRMQVSIMITLLTDMAGWYIDGKGNLLISTLNYIVTMIHFTMQVVVVVGWWRYASYRITGYTMPRKSEFVFVWLPLSMITLIILSTPWTRLYFYLDEANHYHRGILSLPMFIINLLYPLSVSIIAVVKGLRENFRERRSELFLIALFPLLPIIGGIIQTVSYGLSLIWPCVVISSMIILLHKGSHAILQDPLTGLNNRRSIGRLLKTYEEHQNSSAVLMILDLNNLKYINDHFGHSVGDQALVETANILRTTFRGSPAFLARFDGDEFLIAIPHGDEDLAEKTINKLRENFNQFQKTDTFPYPISVSIGYAAANQHNNLSLYDLLRHADESMYLDKEANRQHACNVKAVG